MIHITDRVIDKLQKDITSKLIIIKINRFTLIMHIHFFFLLVSLWLAIVVKIK